MARVKDAARAWAAVTPHDTNKLAGGTCDALYVGGAGDLVLIGEDGVSATFSDVFAGQVYPFGASIVMASGTTATGIIALYSRN